MSAPLAIQHVSKHYGATPAVLDLSLEIPGGETLALLGPSGCGKSTLLRLVAGLERPDGGQILIGGQDVTGWPPERRHLSLVIQDYALFPHLSALQNAAYGPRARGLNRMDAETRAREALDLVGLGALAGRRVTELSGGQQQRVALARALAPRPGLLLLDEPLSNLDEQLRAELRAELAGLFGRLGTTALLVTHDQREALALAGRVALMRAGRLVQLGPAREVWARPAGAWAAAFLGHRNLLKQPDGTVLLVPEDAVTLGQGNAWPVLETRPMDSGVRVTVGHALGPITLQLSPREAAGLGQTIQLDVHLDQCLTLPDDRA